jgi:short-subunit dehydrogenase
MDVGVVAETGYRGLMHGRRIVVPGALNNLLIQTVRFLPRRLVARVVGRMQGRRRS